MPCFNLKIFDCFSRRRQTEDIELAPSAAPPNPAPANSSSARPANESPPIHKQGRNPPPSLNRSSVAGASRPRNELNVAELAKRIRTEAPFSTCMDSDSAQQIRAFLGKQIEIKVLVGRGDGHGHQQAAVTGMGRVLELGFTGKFLVNCMGDSDNIQRRFDFLAESYPQLQIEHKKRKEFTKAQAALGFCFADDILNYSDNTLHKTYGVDHFVSLNPTDWVMPSNVVHPYESKNTDIYYLLEEGILESTLPTRANERTDANIERCINQLVSGKQEGRWNLVPIYGLHDWPAKAEQRISRSPTEVEDPKILGLTASQELRILAESLTGRDAHHKPVVLPILSQIDAQIVSELAGLDRVKIVHDYTELAALEPQAGDVVFVRMPSLPVHQFQQLVGEADIFVGEGCNSICFAKSRGIPFLHGGRDWSEDSSKERPPKNDMFNNANTALQSAFTESVPRDNPHAAKAIEKTDLLPQQKRAEDVRAFMDNGLAGRLAPFYKEASDNFNRRPDRVFAALMYVLATKEAQGKNV
jgi:hypothetical protein